MKESSEKRSFSWSFNETLLNNRAADVFLYAFLRDEGVHTEANYALFDGVGDEAKT